MAAREAALGAGAVVKYQTAGRLRDHDLRRIAEERPNLILLAGGVEGGDCDTVLFNAGRLARWPALSHHGIPSAAGRGTYASGRSAASPRHYKPPPQVREPAQAGKIPRFRAARH